MFLLFSLFSKWTSDSLDALDGQTEMHNDGRIRDPEGFASGRGMNQSLLRRFLLLLFLMFFLLAREGHACSVCILMPCHGHAMLCRAVSVYCMITYR